MSQAIRLHIPLFGPVFSIVTDLGSDVVSVVDVFSSVLAQPSSTPTPGVTSALSESHSVPPQSIGAIGVSGPPSTKTNPSPPTTASTTPAATTTATTRSSLFSPSLPGGTTSISTPQAQRIAPSATTGSVLSQDADGITAPSLSTSSHVSPTQKPTESSNDTLNTSKKAGLIAGLTVGIFAILCLLIMAIWWFKRRHRRRMYKDSKRSFSGWVEEKVARKERWSAATAKTLVSQFPGKDSRRYKFGYGVGLDEIEETGGEVPLR